MSEVQTPKKKRGRPRKVQSPASEPIVLHIRQMPDEETPITNSDLEKVVQRGYDLPAPEVDVDPWRHKDPTRILMDPPGFKLRWCNAKHRYKRGWDGWVPVRRDEEIGRACEQGLFIPQAPPRLSGYNEDDNFFRLGADMVLCKLPIATWNARKAALDKRNAQVTTQMQMRGNRKIADGVETIGEGLTTDRTPRQPMRGFVATKESSPSDQPTIGNRHRKP